MHKERLTTMLPARILKKGYFAVFILSILALSIYFWHIESQEQRKFLAHLTNYSPKLNLTKMGLILNTSTCQIPNFSPTDPEMLPFIKIPDPYNCKNESSYSLTEIQGNELVVKTKNMGFGDSLFFRNWSCCYKIITRVQQSDDKYGSEADNGVAFSDCIPILKERTKIFHEFIMVECSSGWRNWIKRLMSSLLLIDVNAVSHRNLHIIGGPVLGVADKSSDSFKKIKFWKQQDSTERPPNILLIGLDSTSRLNFQRLMPKTKKVLQDLGAVEMLGFAKVGVNTHPNLCPTVFGYSDVDLKRICHFNSGTKFDNCPSIWKRLDAANYLTALIEDWPVISMFNYLKTGFVRKPVDFYLRPLFIAAREYNHTQELCFGLQTTDEAITSHIETVFETSVEHSTPIFALTWSSTNSHDDHNGIQRSDDTYANFIQRLINKGYLKNTVLVFMGDHGYRHGAIKRTQIGNYEDKLPNFWISLPKNIQKRFPSWMQQLHLNSRRLTSPFTLYWTLNLILDSFTSTPGPSDSNDNTTGELIPRKHKQNFFEAIPESNFCEDVGIPDSFCPCDLTNHVELNDTLLIKSARLSILKVNRDILAPNSNCSQLQISNITTGGVIKKRSKDGWPVLRYSVGFQTQPGSFLLEAEVNYFSLNRTFSSNLDVQRTSKIDKTHVKCVSDSNLELFCFCKY